MSDRICTGPECVRPADTKGLCPTHYMQEWTGKPLTPIRPRGQLTVTICIGPECDRPPYTKNLCRSHIAQIYRGEELRPLRPQRPKTVDPVEWFLAGIDTSGGEDACHEWQRGFSGEYGRAGYDVVETDRTPDSHVVQWILNNGPITDDLFVCHTCDNPPCCNIRHLFLDTHEGNVDDMVAKDRHARGERNGGGGKLTESQVLEIRARCAAGEKQIPLAAEFGISQGTVSRIHLRQGWKHLDT